MSAPNLRALEEKVARGEELLPTEEKIIISRVDDYWENHPDVTYKFPRWKKYLAWTAGYQRSDYNTASGKFVKLPRKGQRKLIFNRIRNFVRILLAKMNSDRTRDRVIPKTGDYEDAQASRVGDSIIAGLKHKLGWEELDIQAKLWLILCNRVGARVIWNKDDKGIVDYRNTQQMDDNGEPLMSNGQPVMTDEIEPVYDDHEGDVSIEIINPFSFRTDPLYVDRRKWRFFLFGEEVDAEELEEEYELEPGSLTKPKSDSANVLDTAFELTTSSDGEWTGVGIPEEKEDVTGRTVIRYELWTPSAYFFIAGTTILAYGPNERGIIPYFVADERTIPIGNYEKGIVYNEGFLRDAIPIQREYNRQMSLLSKSIERASRIKVLLPENSVLSKKAFSNEFGTFIPVNTRLGKPEQMKLDTMPTFLPQYLDVLDRAFGSAFNVHPASLGELPERASHASGALLSLLLEQDDIVLDPTLKLLNKFWGDVWSYALTLVQDNYNLPRYLTFMGDDGQYAVEKFRGAQLRGNTTVLVESQSGLPRSRALKIEYIMTLFNAGLLQDPKDVLEMLEFGTAEKIFQDQRLHENRALRENERIEQDPEIDPETTASWVYEFEEHLTHVKIHLRDLLGPKGENYTDQQRQALDVHTRLHIQIMMQNKLREQGADEEEPTETPSQEGSTSEEQAEGAPQEG